MSVKKFTYDSILDLDTLHTNELLFLRMFLYPSTEQKKSSGILSRRYQQHDPLPFEITEARFFNLVLSTSKVDLELNKLIDSIKNETIKFRHPDRINA